MESNCNVDICEEGANSIEGIPGDDNFTDDIFRRGTYISEGFSGVVYFTGGNEQKDCNYIEDTGVESVKGMSMFHSP